MKQLLACLMVGASLTGCSSTPIELPTCDIPAPLAEVAKLQAVPDMPTAVGSTDTTATFDLEGVLQLDRVHKASESNKKVGDLNAAALEARNEEVNAFIECARYSTMWMEIREDMLEQERQDHKIDNMWHRGLIVLGAIAVSL